MSARNRLCLSALVVLLCAAHTLQQQQQQQQSVQKPYRGQVRFADDQHIPIRPKVAAANPAKTKASAPTKTKKPVTPAAQYVDLKKKTPVKPIPVAAAVKSEYLL